MDRCRRLLPLASDDPHVLELTLVGIWVCGLNNVLHPTTLAACYRFNRSLTLRDKATTNGSFLLLFFGQGDYSAKLYECKLDDGDSCSETFSVYKSRVLDRKQAKSGDIRVKWNLEGSREGTSNIVSSATASDTTKIPVHDCSIKNSQSETTRGVLDRIPFSFETRDAPQRKRVRSEISLQDFQEQSPASLPNCKSTDVKLDSQSMCDNITFSCSEKLTDNSMKAEKDPQFCGFSIDDSSSTCSSNQSLTLCQDVEINDKYPDQGVLESFVQHSNALQTYDVSTEVSQIVCSPIEQEVRDLRERVEQIEAQLSMVKDLKTPQDNRRNICSTSTCNETTQEDSFVQQEYPTSAMVSVDDKGTEQSTNLQTQLLDRRMETVYDPRQLISMTTDGFPLKLNSETLRDLQISSNPLLDLVSSSFEDDDRELERLSLKYLGKRLTS